MLDYGHMIVVSVFTKKVSLYRHKMLICICLVPTRVSLQNLMWRGTVPLVANEKGSKDEIDKKMSLYIILSSIYILLL